MRTTSHYHAAQDACYVLPHTWSDAASRVSTLDLPHVLADALSPEALGTLKPSLGSGWEWVELLGTTAVLLEPSLLLMRHSETASLQCLLLDDAAIVWTGLHAHTRHV